MGQKQIKEITLVDQITGEVLSRKALYSNKFSESFIMVRTTEGLDWLFKLNANECKLILLLHKWSEASNGRLSISGWQREFICDKLQIKPNMVSFILRGLASKDCLIKIGNNDYVVNPAHVFKCSTSEVRERIRDYEHLKSKL